MSDDIEREEEAPRILGVDMIVVTHEETGRGVRWSLDFASLCVVLDPHCIYETFTDSAEWSAYVGKQQVAHIVPLLDCVAAVERELLAISGAIPARAAESRKPSSGKVCPHVFCSDCARAALAGWDPMAEPKPEELLPTTRELIETVRVCLPLVPTNSPSRAAVAALAELARRLESGER